MATIAGTGAGAPTRPSPAASAGSGAAVVDGRGNVGSSARLAAVVQRILANIHRIDNRGLFTLLVSLARGVDYAVVHNEIPEVAKELPMLIKQVCKRKSDIGVLSAIMVLMNSIKIACGRGWFIDVEVGEFNLFANQLTSCFSTKVHPTVEPTAAFLVVSELMPKFYPQLTLGEIIVSIEAKTGYEILLSEFHISKSSPPSSKGRISLLVAQTDNIESSSCIINPPDVNFLINGKGIENRVCSPVNTGPQLPSDVTSMLVYGTNLLQVIGQFKGNFIIILAHMSVKMNSVFQVSKEQLQEYTPPEALKDTMSDGDLIEGPSRISLNCPISFKRIKTPVKGHLCRHYQCFDYDNFVEMNTRRPSWRCPHCNQSISFCDIRIDRNMTEVLSQVKEDVEDVLISSDGTWKFSSKEHMDDDCQLKTSSPFKQIELEADLLSQNGSELSKSNAENDIIDLTMEDLDYCAPDDLVRNNSGETETRKPFHDSLSGVENVLVSPVFNTSGAAMQGIRHSDLYNELWSCLMKQPEIASNGGHNLGATVSETTFADCMTREPFRSPQSLTYTTGGNSSPIMTDAVSPAFTRAASHTSAAPAIHSAELLQRGSFTENLQSQQQKNRFLNSSFGGNDTVQRLLNARPPSAHQILPAEYQGPNSPAIHSAELQQRGSFTENLQSQQQKNRFLNSSFGGDDTVQRLLNARLNARPPSAHQISPAEYQGPNSPVTDQRLWRPASHGTTLSTAALVSPTVSCISSPLPPISNSAACGMVGISMDSPGPFRISGMNPPLISNLSPAQAVSLPAVSLSNNSMRTTTADLLQQRADGLGKKIPSKPTLSNVMRQHVNCLRQGLNVQPVNLSDASTVHSQSPRPSSGPSSYNSIGFQQRQGQRIGGILTPELRTSTAWGTAAPGTMLSQGTSSMSGRDDVRRSPGIEGDQVQVGQVSSLTRGTASIMTPELPSDKNWRPTGLMRGSIVGRSYSAAISDLILEPSSAAASASTHARSVSFDLSPRLPFTRSITGDPQGTAQSKDMPGSSTAGN